MRNFSDIDSSHVAAAVIAFVLFTVSHKVSGFLHLTMHYSVGVSLIYIPAGVKLLCLLVGGVPASIGLIASSLFLNYLQWTDSYSLSMLSFGIVGVLSYGLAVYLVCRQFRIKPDLSNLNYLHIVTLSIAASVLNGVGQNFAYLAQGVAPEEALIARSAAMAFGDFLGCFVVVILFNLSTHAVKKTRARQQ